MNCLVICESLIKFFFSCLLLQEVDALLSENEMLQVKLQSQEEDFRLQNSTLMAELSKVFFSSVICIKWRCTEGICILFSYRSPHNFYIVFPAVYTDWAARTREPRPKGGSRNLPIIKPHLQSYWWWASAPAGWKCHPAEKDERCAITALRGMEKWLQIRHRNVMLGGNQTC